jgi:hypothetical protein
MFSLDADSSLTQLHPPGVEVSRLGSKRDMPRT